MRKSLYFQVDAFDEDSEKIILNSKFLSNITPEIKQLFGFGKESSYPVYPKTNLNRLPINSKVLSLLSKWFVYRLVRTIFRTEPRRIAKFLKNLFNLNLIIILILRLLKILLFHLKAILVLQDNLNYQIVLF